MSYVRNIEYKIIPSNTFKILRGCTGCGCKQIFSSTGNFRVNANGNHLDVWLIYACEKCGKTYNLPIYERTQLGKLSKVEYQAFLSNDVEVAFKYGTNKSVFAKK